MKSIEGEYVDFVETVDLSNNEKKGQVEKWLFEIDLIQKDTLRNITK